MGVGDIRISESGKSRRRDIRISEGIKSRRH